MYQLKERMKLKNKKMRMKDSRRRIKMRNKILKEKDSFCIKKQKWKGNY